MTARVPRSFADAFTGVYGAPPESQYGRFAAEFTYDAIDASTDGQRPALLESAADTVQRLGEETLVQRLHWATGAPALSRDDSVWRSLSAIPQHAPRVVILNLNRRTADSAARERARAHALDPEDVAAVPPPHCSR